jgi:Transposase DDE domain
MLGLTCLPKKVANSLAPFKRHFGCAQARHFLLFGWLLVVLILDFGKGTIKGLSRLVPKRIRYWALLRLIRSGQWDAQALIEDMAAQTLALLPPPRDGVLYLIGDTTLKSKRGHKHPLGHKTRMNEYAGYTFGFAMVLLVASWDRYRVPVRLALVDPKHQGHPNILFRQMLRDFLPPQWAKQVVVLADAGMAATKTFRVIRQKQYGYVFAVSRNRKFSDGKHLQDLVRHLPKSCYHRLASSKPDGRRKDYWVYSRPAALNDLGEVTLILSKQRRNQGPKKVKLLVTNLTQARVKDILSIYSRRWGVELTFKELKGGLHLGRMQVTKDAERVARSVALSVLAYLLLVRLYGRDQCSQQEFSLFQLKHRFISDACREQLQRTERRWQEKLDQLRPAA